MKINKNNIREFGMTAGWRGCISANRGGTAVNHSEECRKRMEEALSKKGDKRMEKCNQRLVEIMGENKPAESEAVEKQDDEEMMEDEVE